MSRRRRNVDDLQSLTAKLGQEDGSDPREFHSKPWNAPKKASRKGLQLCGQVRDALIVALPSCADPVLRDLAVLGVEPAPHSGRLRVLLRGQPGTDPNVAMAVLHRASGYLRSEVSESISRRHAPELVFEFIL